MSARNEDFLFAQEAQNLGYVSEEQIEEGFLLQKRMADELQIDERLAVILVKRGWIAEEQARRVYGIIEPQGSRGQIEGYRLVQIIGRGAMGTVYKAIHKGLHRVVAIKVLRRDLAADKTQIERLKREAELLADLDHPNVVRAFDAGESNGFPYLVMEYVEGETLRDRIARRGPLSDEEALRITRALADALERARRMGIVHRDIKPGNVLISRSGTPKIMDLGLAKGPLDMGLTQHGATVGTPQFISPEQAQDPRRADTRSDIYSLGAALYAMVTTRPPFEGSTLAEIITKVLYQQPVPPRVRNPDVSPEVGHLIERMMLKDPSLRYQTPAQVVADIDSIRGGQSIVPTGFRGNWEAYLLRQRQRTWLHRGAIVVAVLVLLGVGGNWYLARERRGRAQEEIQDLTTQLLALPDVAAGDDVDAIRARIARAQRLYESIGACEDEGGVHCPRRADVERRMLHYTENLDSLAKFENVEQGSVAAASKGNFKDALRHAIQFQADSGRFPRSQRRATDLVLRLTQESDAHWRERQAAVLRGTAGNLHEFTERWRAWRAALEGRYAETPARTLAGRRARMLEEAALNIQKEVVSVAEAYSGAALAPRVEALEFFDLKRELGQRVSEAVAAIEGHWEAFRTDPVGVPKTLLLGENGYARAALRRIEAGVDRAVEDHWQALRREAEGVASDAALQRIEGFLAAAERGGYYPTLAREARVEAEARREERSQRLEAADAAARAARVAVLRALRRGVPSSVRHAVDDALALPALGGRERVEIEGLRTGADALESLYGAAVAYLEAVQAGGLRLTDVKLRGPDGAVVVAEGTWSDVRVDPETRTIRARVQRRASRRDDLVMPLRDVHLDQLRAWARRSGRSLSASTEAVIDLARQRAVEDAPGQDLRERILAYRDVLERFERIEADGAWSILLRALVAQLEAFQRAREAIAGGHLARAGLLMPGGKYVPALEHLELLVSKVGRLRFTRVFDTNEATIRAQMKLCRDELDQQELLRMVPGADVEELAGGRHRFVFDLDDPSQLRNFERGFGALVPHGGAAITPYGNVPQRLLLLKDVQGVLRDRPLSMLSPFDPQQEIVLDVTLHTLRGSFLVAFDIDGVQLAVCSADPNYWKWRLRPGTPLLEDEQNLPEFDYYGRGRGIAFHEGRSFGSSFPLGNWSWPAIGQGPNFRLWKDREWLGKRQRDLFAFEPGRRYAVKVVRNRGELRFYVDGKLIVQRHKTSWAQRGDFSELESKIRQGSGRIQILTWTPLAIDDLRIEGRVMDRWRKQQKARIEAETRLRSEREGGAK